MYTFIYLYIQNTCIHRYRHIYVYIHIQPTHARDLSLSQTLSLSRKATILFVWQPISRRWHSHIAFREEIHSLWVHSYRLLQICMVSFSRHSHIAFGEIHSLWVHSYRLLQICMVSFSVSVNKRMCTSSRRRHFRSRSKTYSLWVPPLYCPPSPIPRVGSPVFLLCFFV